MPNLTDIGHPILSALLQFGAFGAIVAWLVLFLVPKLQENARADREIFTTRLEKISTDFRDEMRIERESHRVEHHELGERFDRAVTRLEDAIREPAAAVPATNGSDRASKA